MRGGRRMADCRMQKSEAADAGMREEGRKAVQVARCALHVAGCTGAQGVWRSAFWVSRWDGGMAEAEDGWVHHRGHGVHREKPRIELCDLCGSNSESPAGDRTSPGLAAWRARQDCASTHSVLSSALCDLCDPLCRPGLLPRCAPRNDRREKRKARSEIGLHLRGFAPSRENLPARAGALRISDCGLRIGTRQTARPFRVSSWRRADC